MGVIRFFDIDYAFKAFEGTISASSGVPENAFDQSVKTFWQSIGENTDGNAIYIERDFQATRSINRIFLRQSNVLDVSFEYWNGSAYVALPILTTTTSADGLNKLFEFAAVSTQKIKLLGSTTVVPNQEKKIYDAYYFTELGQLTNPPAEIKSAYVTDQIKHQMDNAKYFIARRGSRWEIELGFNVHVTQADITLIEMLAQRTSEFFIWLNNGNETDFSYKFSPFKFEDLIKVSPDGKFTPEFYKNLFFSGVSFGIKLLEVV